MAGSGWQSDPCKAFAPPGLRLLVAVQKVLKEDCRMETSPWRFWRLCLTLVKGSAMAFMLTPELLQGSDPHSWLSKTKSLEMSGATVFMIEEGSTLFCPMGLMPVIVGIPSDKELLDPRLLHISKRSSK